MQNSNINPDARLMTDSFVAYREPGKAFASHETIDHSKGEYVRGDAHTNTVEGFYSQLKRSIDGMPHSISEKHLPRYSGEFDYRYNTRKITDGERTEQTIQQTAGKRLRYKNPTTKLRPSHRGGGIARTRRDGASGWNGGASRVRGGDAGEG